MSDDDKRESAGMVAQAQSRLGTRTDKGGGGDATANP